MIFGISGSGNREGDSVTIGQLCAVLERLQQFSVAAGAKVAAQDLKTFSDMLAPYADHSVTAFCADIRAKLQSAAEKPKGRKKATAPKPHSAANDDAVGQYIAELRSTGTDRPSFDAVFDKLRADKSLKAAAVGEIARQYANSVTKYKSMSAAHTDISKAFVRQARFENKLA